MRICPPTFRRTAHPHAAQNSRKSRPRQCPLSVPVVVTSASAKLARCAALEGCQRWSFGVITSPIRPIRRGVLAVAELV